MSNERTLLVGSVCAGRYLILGSMGEGSMGQLFRAERIADGRAVVLKCAAARGGSAREQLRSEAEALASLDHPHIVRAIEHEEGSDICVLVMEALEGEDLGQRLRTGVIEARQAMRWLRELAGALDHLHARGLVHRDIKPANVMLHEDESGRSHAVLIDFGLAGPAPGAASPARARFLCGTPAYMAPEQALGMESQIGPATDRYALAALALEMLTGQRPYPTASIGELLVMLVEQPPRKPSALGDFDGQLDEVFARAMARDPARRFVCAVAMLEAIAAVVPRSRRAARRARTSSTATPTVRARAA